MLRVGDSPELQAAVLGFKVLPREIQKRIRQNTVRTMGGVWKDEVNARARTKMDRRMLAVGARIAGGNPPVAVAANSRRRVGDELMPVMDWPGWEFGANRDKRTTYSRRSPKGKVHKVTRRTRRQLPARDPDGRVVFAAVREVAPRLASMYVQTVVKTVHQAAEGDL